MVTDRATIGPCDSVVICVGYQPDNALAQALDAAGIKHTLIGDAVKPRRINDAVTEGFEAGYAIA